MRGLSAEIPHLRLLETPETCRRAGLGRTTPCGRARDEAKSAWLLFTDADAELAPEAVARALQIARETGAALVSFSPEQ